MPRTSPSDVREAIDETGNTSEYPDDELAYEIEMATQVVDEQVAPFADGSAPLAMIETEVAAALVRSDPETPGAISSETEGQAQISYAVGETVGEKGWSHWERAKMLDPTGRLGASTGSFKVF